MRGPTPVQLAAPETIRVAVVDDDPFVRRSLVEFLSTVEDVDCVGHRPAQGGCRAPGRSQIPDGWNADGRRDSRRPPRTRVLIWYAEVGAPAERSGGHTTADGQRSSRRTISG